MSDEDPIANDPTTPPAEAELIERIRSIDEPAPERLHEHVQAMIDGAAGRRAGGSGTAIGLGLSARSRLGWGATALAAAVAAIVIAFAGSTTNGPTLSEATALTLRAPSMPAPAEDVADRTQLDAAVDGIAFPYWKGHFGWRASGQRIDNLYGRTIRTVFYTDSQGLRVGYAIVAGEPAPGISSGSVHWRSGVQYHLTHEHGAAVVTWTRDGHLCIVSGRDVSPQTLIALASWTKRGTLS